MTGRELKALRKRLGLTQSQLADRMGCSRQHVYHIEHHPNPPLKTVLAVQQIAAVMAVENA